MSTQKDNVEGIFSFHLNSYPRDDTKIDPSFSFHLNSYPTADTKTDPPFLKTKTMLRRCRCQERLFQMQTLFRSLCRRYPEILLGVGSSLCSALCIALCSALCIALCVALCSALCIALCCSWALFAIGFLYVFVPGCPLILRDSEMVSILAFRLLNLMPLLF